MCSSYWRGDSAVLATMHGKQRVIAPLVERFLGLRVAVAPGLNTDGFGTFTRDIPRAGSPLDAARGKINAGFLSMPGWRVGLASEGSFAPHPQLPFCAVDREIVLLVDREMDLELTGYFATPDTNFSHTVVTTPADGVAFADRIGFPRHGLIVMGCLGGEPAPEIALHKNITHVADLVSTLEQVIEECGAAFVQTDMRAHRNPRRMRAIRRATIDLVRRARSLCPECGRPGFAVTEHVAGRRCALCSAPTMLTQAEILSCCSCNHRIERPVALAAADPAYCGECNP